MLHLGHVAKPWYVWRPWQLARRVQVSWRAPQNGYVPLPVAWGTSVIADPARMIGRSIVTTGVYDLSVSELLARLIMPGDTVVDAGANVGYMTMLASIVTGPRGRVVSWEPHPDLVAVLEQNVVRLARVATASPITVRAAALGAKAGQATLVIPSHIAANDGVSFIGTPMSDATSVSVPVETIDDVMGDTPIAVMKLDVEGSERALLAGAERALASRRVTHIVFEDHVGVGSDVFRVLASHGYSTFSIGWSLSGLRLSDRAGERLAAEYEAPSYVASLEPRELVRRCSARGWSTLSRRFIRRRLCA